MNRRKCLIMALAAVLTVVGCKKDDEWGEKQFVEFTAQIEQTASNGQKVHFQEVTDDGGTRTGLKPCWDAGDVLQINNGTGTVSEVHSNNPTVAKFSSEVSTDGGFRAVFPNGRVKQRGGLGWENATISTTSPIIELPRVQVYEVADGVQKINAPMAAYNPSRPSLEFKNLCGLLEINIENNKAWDMILDSIQVESSGANVSGYVSYDISGINVPGSNPVISTWEEGYKVVSLAGANNSSMNERLNSSQNRSDVGAATTSGGKTTEKYYVYLPPVASGAGNTFTIRVFSHPIFNKADDVNRGFAIAEEEEDRVHIVYQRTSTSGAGYIERNEVVPLTFQLSAATRQVYTSQKRFSVDASGTQVCFSRGYVQYNISTNKWRFAPRQWSFMNPPQDIRIGHESDRTYQYNSSVALPRDIRNTITYMTGTTWVEFFGWGTGDNPRRCGLPSYMISQASVGSGNEPDLTSTSDWGTNFTNTGATWYTPSRDQYQYVFKGRTTNQMDDPVYPLPTTDGHTWKFGWATVTGGNWGEDNTTNGWSGDIAVVILIPDHVNPMRFNLEKGGRRLGINAFKSSESAMTGTITDTEGGDNTDSDASDSDDETNIKDRNDNNYTKAQLEYLEAHGCIIFPCIGHFRKVGGGDASIYYYNNDATQFDQRLNPPDVRIWSRTKRNGTTAYYSLFDSGNPDGSQPHTRNVLKAHDDACDLHCVRLICSKDTPYKWDPDQM